MTRAPPRKTKSRATSQGPDVKGSARTSAVKAILDAMPGATAELTPGPPGAAPPSVMYKVMGKVFAILSIRGAESVALKCDPHMGDILRAQYSGIGDHRHWLRNWISVGLDADVPLKETKHLVAASYDIVCAGLTRKQKADLAALSG